MTINPCMAVSVTLPNSQGEVALQWKLGDQTASLMGTPSELATLLESSIRCVQRAVAGDFGPGVRLEEPFLCRITPTQP